MSSSQIKREKRVVGKPFITNQSFKVIRCKLDEKNCCGTCTEMYKDKSTGKLSVTLSSNLPFSEMQFHNELPKLEMSLCCLYRC